MSRCRRHGRQFLGVMFTPRLSTLLRILVGLIAVILLSIQTIHPGVHPAEVLGPSTHPQMSCPIAHAVGDLPQGLSILLFTLLVVAARRAPRLWLGHSCFIHVLAPRPPPAPPL
jgi:hypothetical protein